MAGAVVIIVLLVLAPVFIVLGFTPLAGVIGHLLWKDAEERHEDSELLDIGV